MLNVRYDTTKYLADDVMKKKLGLQARKIFAANLLQVVNANIPIDFFWIHQIIYWLKSRKYAIFYRTKKTMKTCGNCNEIKIVYRLFWHKAWLSRWRYCKLKSIWLNRNITAICEKKIIPRPISLSNDSTKRPKI